MRTNTLNLVTAVNTLLNGIHIPGTVATPRKPRAEIVESTDAAGSRSTSATMSVGDTFDGTISGSSDSDWIAVDLTAGESYVFSIWGRGGSLAGLSDTYLSLHNSTGRTVATNGDITEANNFSQISFTANSSGTYYIAASGEHRATGNYTVQAATNVFSVQQVSNQMTKFGWGIETTLQHDERAGDRMTVNLTGLTSAGQKLALWALEAWTSVSGLVFDQTSSSGADLVIDDSQSGAFGGPNRYVTATGEILQASVNISRAWLDYYGTTLDSYSFLTYLHEIGHALGLMHSGNYNGSASYGRDNHFLNDSHQMTIMSYFDIGDNSFVEATDYRPVTPMIADIHAIQSLYGNPNSHVGDTVWGASSNVGGYLGTLFGYLYDGDTIDRSIYRGGAVGLTIYDGGGSDLIDVSTRSEDQNVDLREGAISDVAGHVGNLIIGIGTQIEHLSTGSGNDLLIGNDAANHLIGNGGFDTLQGGNGRDTLDGGSHADSIDGGSGNDLLLGGSGFDHLNGGTGHDTLLGGATADRLTGGAGNDVLRAGSNLGMTVDGLWGEAGDDRLYGEGGFDFLDGGAGADHLDGGHQADNLYGRAGDDTLVGGDGLDRLFGGADDDVGFGGAGNDGLFGEQGNDTLIGNAGNDRFFGGPGNDRLQGDHGNDTLNGGAGFDTLTGGAGNDILQGDFNADRFVFADDHGDDVITDFAATNRFEKIDLSGISEITGLTDLVDNHLRQEGSDVIIETGSGSSITLPNTDIADLDATDFLL
ncbi:M10 family metallopeptidase C-terminal domain-containing protein [Cognatishimia sp. 1_MG-2023]|uniref:M10 family metallopeptidase C-terminal domain-containing protein n=1 Tax=Cognatishimia sp. 1_MG-2023 TaxID=3062642 RepID=UPI0026E43852|nr:M10 family metallopeptidase C-terminal domain-containing protein [Cognatishimia sp. 1_MG-2023]MDO6728090.1 M10 family metallopeptidase C-terminal domain-containing protein [Cognatishimia sp. 1_MG-2023]